MAVSNEVFIDIEAAISKRLRRGWRSKVEDILRKVDAALRNGDFDRAHRELDDLDLSDLVDKAQGYLKTMLKASFLFGVSGVANPKESQADSSEVEETLEKAVRQLRGMVKAAVQDSVLEIGHRMIAEAEIEQRASKSDSGVARKAAVSMDNVENFNKKMRKEGDARVAALAGLQNSRMASWGFTVEATIRGVSKYEVNEVMDSLTCPVCQEMHGRVFEVEHAKQKLEQQLNVDDPAELKEMAPWPKQNKDSLAELQEMSDEEIQAMGWDTPPYHPGCRGVLRFKSSSTRVEDQEVTLTDVLPSGSQSVAEALASLEGLKKVTDARVAVPLTVATTATKEKVEAMKTKALAGDATVQNVKLSRIASLDSEVDKAKVEDVIKNGASTTPLVVKRSGRYYVLEGLEVLLAAKLSGSDTAPVRVYKP